MTMGVRISTNIAPRGNFEATLYLQHPKHSYVIPSEVEGPLMFRVSSHK